MCRDESKNKCDALFPQVDRSVVSVGVVSEESDEKAYWQQRSVEDRLEAMELYRIIAYGYDACTARLQRILEIAEFPPC